MEIEKGWVRIRRLMVQNTGIAWDDTGKMDVFQFFILLVDIESDKDKSK